MDQIEEYNSSNDIDVQNALKSFLKDKYQDATEEDIDSVIKTFNEKISDAKNTTISHHSQDDKEINDIFSELNKDDKIFNGSVKNIVQAGILSIIGLVVVKTIKNTTDKETQAKLEVREPLLDEINDTTKKQVSGLEKVTKQDNLDDLVKKVDDQHQYVVDLKKTMKNTMEKYMQQYIQQHMGDLDKTVKDTMKETIQKVLAEELKNHKNQLSVSRSRSDSSAKGM